MLPFTNRTQWNDGFNVTISPSEDVITTYAALNGPTPTAVSAAMTQV